MNIIKKIFLPVICVFITVSLFSACGSMGALSSIGATIAQKAGVIDKNTATAISNSGQALAQAGATITPEQEYYIGRAVAANILTHYKIDSSNPALTQYLNDICATITVNSSRPDIYNGYHVAILDSDEINAFSTSGGHIFVTRGLIACTDSEDSLAAVLAHEIAHIQLKHSLKAIKTNRINTALLTTVVSAGAAASKKDVQQVTDMFNNSVGDIVNTMLNSGYSQTQEFAADSTALGLLANAGYNPSAMLTMLKLLEKGEQGKTGGFVKTHPSPEARIANVEKTLGQYKVTDTSSYRTARYKEIGLVN
jgi:predicted Zn-dependent protease